MRPFQPTRRGLTLLELLAVITILGILAAMAMSRVSVQALDAKKKCCLQYRADINGALETYYFETGAFASSLSEIENSYYPAAIPPCPVSGATYVIDPSSHRIDGHTH